MAFFNPFDVVTSGAKAVPGMPGMGPSQEAINAGKVGGGQQQSNPWGATPATPNAMQSGSLAALGGGVNQGYDWTAGSPNLNGPQPMPTMPWPFPPDTGSRAGMPQPPTQGGPIINPQPVPGMPPIGLGGGNGLWNPPGGQGDPDFTQPYTPTPDLTQQDYENTQKRLGELSQFDPRYPVPFAGRNPNDPRNNELDVLNRRMYQWQAQQQRNGGGQKTDPYANLPPFDPSQYQTLAGNRGSGQPINQPMATSQPLPWDGSGGQSSMGGSLQSLGGGQLNQSGMVNLRGTDGTTKAVPQQDLAHWLSRGAVRV